MSSRDLTSETDASTVTTGEFVVEHLLVGLQLLIIIILIRLSSKKASAATSGDYNFLVASQRSRYDWITNSMKNWSRADLIQIKLSFFDLLSS